MTTAFRSLIEWFERVDRRNAGLAIALSLVPAWYLSWLLADFGLRGIGFVVGWIAVSWVLVSREWPRALGIAWLRILAGLLLLTPIFLVIPFVLNAGRFGIGKLAGFVLTESNLIAIVVFALLAAVPAVIAHWLAHTDATPGGMIRYV
jgi:hypothetical protein